MTSKDLRQKYLDFFKSKGHAIIPSAPLVPSDDEQLEGKEKVLFTTAGMQPIIPYLFGKAHPEGKRLADCQKCLRTDDIDEVGDNTHHTFFEMLGNWSLGDYWKKEAIEYSFEFLTRELGIPLEKLAVSVFAGDSDTPRDEESAKAWKDQGISEDRIAYLGKEDNWWPTNPSAIGPCGPDTEMFCWTGGDSAPEKFDPEDKKWVEIWNDVFMEFNRKEDGALEELPQRNVDTGMGLERTLAVLNGKDNNYETDLFEPIIDAIVRIVGKSYEKNQTDIRIIADHFKAAVFLIDEGVEPSNKLGGYVLRKLLRRSAVKIYELIGGVRSIDEYMNIVKPIVEIYSETYFKDKESLLGELHRVLANEMTKFANLLIKGMKEVEKIEKIDGKIAFDLYQTYGFPYEVTEELFLQKGQKIDREQFKSEFEKHKELSRTASAGMFKGGLAGHSEIETKYHTATHLLHQALRDVLGDQVFQKGSNINTERLRFDFSFDRRMDIGEIRKVEDLVNELIKKDLKVEQKFMSVDEAKAMNAIGLFNEKYEETVSIYCIGPDYELDSAAKDQRDRAGYYSVEFCGGPHVEHTGIIGGIKITKEEAVSAGVRRIYAELA